jgi:nitrogen fixation/metabolism regulation signal transduction histidine kinase
MSIRYRLALMCVVVALLPAIPLSILVSNLIKKSFNVGLSETMGDALDSGVMVSRQHLETLRATFEAETRCVVSKFRGAIGDSSDVSAYLSGAGRESAAYRPIDGFFVTDTAHVKSFRNTDPPLPPELAGHSLCLMAAGLVDGAVVRRPAGPGSGLTFYETETRTAQFALWNPPRSRVSWLFYKRTDPEFLSHAENLIAGRQLFAGLRLTRERLSRSFFYPFIVIYAVMLALSLLLALVMAERLAAPLRRLAGATSAVASGDWSLRLKERTGGEIGRLADGFNHMVESLDRQQRRLLDLEKLAAWREVGRHLAHEIKNPILPIRLTVQEMRDQYRGEDKAYQEMLSDSVRVVEDELAHLQTLVKEFSAFARMPGLSPARGSMGQLVHDVARLYPRARTEIAVEPGLPDSVFDPDQMRRVLINLIDNSLSVMPAGREATIRIEVRKRGGSIALELADNGPGIPPENIARIFDPYFTTRSEGTGLGLSIAKNIVVLHGGTMEAASPGGEGAVFHITLPIRGPSQDPGAKGGEGCHIEEPEA